MKKQHLIWNTEKPNEEIKKWVIYCFYSSSPNYHIIYSTTRYINDTWKISEEEGPRIIKWAILESEE